MNKLSNTGQLGKFCPVCKLSNEPGAQICAYCGAPLELPSGPPTTQRMGGPNVAQPDRAEEAAKGAAPPKQGLALYMANTAKSVGVMTEKEFLIGRMGEDDSEPMIDLTLLEGFALGVSRRHALIRLKEKGYEIIDLDSKNGTWVNGQRLVPNQAYDLPNGAHLVIGRMELTVLHEFGKV